MTGSVLIVDDEPNIVLSLRFLMEHAGCDVRVAHDGDEALRMMGEKPADVVLLDVMIPKKDGYEVCQTIRSTPDWKDAYVIMLTAKGREVEREKGLAIGADEYVTKPFSTRDLSKRVQEIVGQINASKA